MYYDLSFYINGDSDRLCDLTRFVVGIDRIMMCVFSYKNLVECLHKMV